jgi:4-hydroxyphenylpyruvate dioxygenase-like putative hemolysin
VFVFKSPLQPTGKLSEEMGRHLAAHGDAAKDVAFAVDNARAMYEVSDIIAAPYCASYRNTCLIAC